SAASPSPCSPRRAVPPLAASESAAVAASNRSPTDSETACSSRSASSGRAARAARSGGSTCSCFGSLLAGEAFVVLLGVGNLERPLGPAPRCVPLEARKAGPLHRLRSAVI